MIFNKNKQKIDKKTYFNVIIVLILLILFSCGCSYIQKKKEKAEELRPVNNYTSALLEKNNNVYIFNEDEMYLEGVGDLTRLKEMAALSNDWNNIAFKYLSENNKVNIYDMSKKEYRALEIESADPEQISNLSWINDKLVVELYINPTTNKYLIYNAESLELLNTCEGILIDIIDGGNSLVYGVESQGVTSIYVNDNIIYTFESKGEVLLRGRVNESKGDISFITFSFDKETGKQNEYLYRGKIKENKLKDIKQIIKPYEIVGDLAYYGDDLYIEDSETVYLVKDDKFILEEMAESKEKLDNNSKKLKNILKNTFKDENINENLTWDKIGIFNITWFTG